MKTNIVEYIYIEYIFLYETKFSSNAILFHSFDRFDVRNFLNLIKYESNWILIMFIINFQTLKTQITLFVDC